MRSTGDRRLPCSANNCQLFGRDVSLFLNVIDAGDFSDFETSSLPRALHDPGEGPVEPGCLILDLLEHRLREIETLFAFVAALTGVLVLTHVCWTSYS